MKVCFRNFSSKSQQAQFYQKLHVRQTVALVDQKLHKFVKLQQATMSIQDVLERMNDFEDPSDPDVHISNLIHAYQTAERCRKAHPENKALQVCSLIHDVGKILYSFGEPNWAIVGDTFVVGCAYPRSVIFYKTLLDNPDFENSEYNSRLGIYSEKCGMKNLKISFGHDEYLYLVLSGNRMKHHLPEEYWDIIRFHSLYPWHSDNAYMQFMTLEDVALREKIRQFNSFDLYSKADSTFVLTNDIKEYYATLLAEFFPVPLNW